VDDNRRESQGAVRRRPPFAGHLGRTHDGSVRAVAVTPDGEEIVKHCFPLMGKDRHG